MSIWNKVLVGVISFACLFLFYMATRALKTQIAWSDCARQHEARIQTLEKQNRELMEGTDTEPGIRKLRIQLNELLVDRRRMWLGCQPTPRSPNRNAGTVEVPMAVAQVNSKGEPVPHGIAQGTILYAFEELNVKDKGQVLGDFDVGQYLGEFAVSAAKPNDNKVTLVPTSTLNASEVDRIVKAKRPWVLCELLPRDNHEIFASLSDDEKKKLLPADSLRDYLKDGKPAEKDDPKDCVVDGNYVRPLYDYGILFNDEHENRMLLGDAIFTLQQDRQLVVAALQGARALVDACATEVAATKADKEKMEHERDLVDAHRKNLEKNLGDMEAWIARLTKLNQAMAGRIAKLQLEAVQRIDQRTREMAHSGAGRL
jgi:hypothetical protein